MAQRFAQAGGVIFACYAFVFGVLTVLPGDPISARLSNPDANYSPEEISELRAYYGLNAPLQHQFAAGIWRALHGDLGRSLSTSQTVTSIVAQALPSTIALASLAMLFALLLSFGVALTAVFAPQSALRAPLRSAPSLFLSIPAFLIGLLLIQFFSFQLGWFQTIRDEGFKSLVLPSITLAIPVSAPIAQILITSFEATVDAHFVAIGRAKGLGAAKLFFAHIVKPSALPSLTIVGVTVGELVGGSVITEAVFGRPGLGGVIGHAVQSQDIPVLQGVVILAAVGYVAINLVVDLCYPLLDARLRVGRYTRAEG